MYPLRSLNVPLGVHVSQFGNPWYGQFTSLFFHCIHFINTSVKILYTFKYKCLIVHKNKKKPKNQVFDSCK